MFRDVGTPSWSSGVKDRRVGVRRLGPVDKGDRGLVRGTTRGGEGSRGEIGGDGEGTW